MTDDEKHAKAVFAAFGRLLAGRIAEMAQVVLEMAHRADPELRAWALREVKRIRLGMDADLTVLEASAQAPARERMS